jgi:hypothetical protein
MTHVTQVYARFRGWTLPLSSAEAGQPRAQLPSVQQLESRFLLSTTAYLSFGPTGTIVSGYTPVDLSPYDAAHGYGWTAAAGLSTVQRSGPDALHQKFVQGATTGSAASFRINLDEGTYNFTFHLGDQAQSHSDMKLQVNGTILDQHINLNAGQFYDRTWKATVGSGVATISLTAASGSTFALDGLDITPYFNVGVTVPSTISVNTPGTYRLSPSGSTGPYAYSFLFQDGTAQVQTGSSSVTHTFAVDGIYHIMMQVADAYGNWLTEYRDISVVGASTFYITPGGNDTTDGSAARPWATINGPMNHTRFGPGDQILFRGGVTFQGGLYLDDTILAGTDSNPVTFGSYGGGRATLTVPVGEDGIGITNAGGVLVEGLDFRGPYSPSRLPPANAEQSGIYFRNVSGQALVYAHVDDVTVTGVAGMAIQVYADHHSSYYDVSVTNSYLYQNYGSGLYIYSDWGQVYQLQNVYVGHVHVFQDYTIPGASYPGFPLWIQNTDGAVVERSVVWDNDLTTNNPEGGSTGIGACESAHVLFQYNEASANFSNGNWMDSGGFDFDGGTQYSIMQYNYAHDNYGEGFLLCNDVPNSGPNTGNVLRFNISQNDGRRNPYGGIILSHGTINNADIYNNTVYVGPNSTGQHVSAFAIQDDAVPNSVHVRNNIFETYGGAYLVSVAIPGTDLQIQSNLYWTNNGDPFRWEWRFTPYSSLSALRAAAPTFEKVGSTAVEIIADPNLVALGWAGTVGEGDALASGLSMYQAQRGTPMGLNQFSRGVVWDPYGYSVDPFMNRYFNADATDFFGNSFGNRTTWRVGADQGPDGLGP